MSHNPADLDIQSQSVSGEASPYEASAVVRYLAHELRQPLSAIESLAYYLELTAPQEDLKMSDIFVRLRHLVEQTNWILSDAVHLVGVSPHHPRLVDLNKLVSEIVAERTEGGEIPVDVDLAARQLLTRLDPDQGNHMLRNLLSFVLQSGNSDTRVTLRTSAPGGEVALEVSATGVDAPVPDLDSMFEPFNAHLPSGSGLALASARRIAEAHGGRVELQPGPERSITLGVAFPEAAFHRDAVD